MRRSKTRAGISVVFFLFILAMTWQSCSRHMAFRTSPVVPAARGDVKVKQDKNNNFSINIDISGLAEVERLQGANKIYVVWIKTENEDPRNIGRIVSRTKTFSRKLRATFEGVSTFKPTAIFITAEEDGTVQYPGNLVVLSTE